MGQNLSIAPEQGLTFDPANMLAITRRLSDILAEEVALLKDMKISQIHKFYDDKIALGSILETYRDILAQNPEFLSSIPERMRVQLKEEAVRFEGLVEEDNRQITRAKEVHKLVMEAVRKTLEKNVIRNSGYNKSGLMDHGERNTYITQPVSVNENI